MHFVLNPAALELQIVRKIIPRMWMGDKDGARGSEIGIGTPGPRNSSFVFAVLMLWVRTRPVLLAFKLGVA